MSHKIKFNLSKHQNKKSLEDQPNEKISISIGGADVSKNKIENLEKLKTKTDVTFIKPVLLDNNLTNNLKTITFPNLIYMD